MNASNPYAPPRAAVDDVRAVEAAQEPAGRGARLGAAVLDAIIGLAVFYGPSLLTGDLQRGMSQMLATQDPMALYGALMGTGGVITFVLFVALVWITIVLVYRHGQTIGKKLVGIRVVRSDGSRASLSRIFWLRNVANSVLSAVAGFVVGLLGLIIASPVVYVLIDHLFIFGEKRQCLHDKLADTIVVRA